MDGPDPRLAPNISACTIVKARENKGGNPVDPENRLRVRSPTNGPLKARIGAAVRRPRTEAPKRKWLRKWRSLKFFFPSF